jgi:hypothetical protein
LFPVALIYLAGTFDECSVILYECVGKNMRVGFIMGNVWVYILIEHNLIHILRTVYTGT